jgi:hypothetical protein
MLRISNSRRGAKPPRDAEVSFVNQFLYAMAYLLLVVSWKLKKHESKERLTQIGCMLARVKRSLLVEMMQ